MTKTIASCAEEIGIVAENTPPSIAAGSIYLLSEHYKLNLTKKSIAKDCGISEVTISKTYKKMFPFKEHLINESDFEKISTAPMFWGSYEDNS